MTPGKFARGNVVAAYNTLSGGLRLGIVASVLQAIDDPYYECAYVNWFWIQRQVVGSPVVECLMLYDKAL